MDSTRSKSARRANRRQRLGVVAILALAFCWVLLLSSTLPVSAAQASAKIQQHWDLLSETVTSQLTATTLTIPRGLLPGGTTKFAPLPTASFEVVGRHVGGQGASRWQVDLLDSANATLARASFERTETTFRIKTSNDDSDPAKAIAFTWPSADKTIASIRLTPVAPTGSVAGTLDLQKAYLKIQQNGVITKTVGRLAMGAKQINITASSYTGLKNGGIYVYSQDDFNPDHTAGLDPVIKLRATAVPTTCQFGVALWDDDSSAVVAGSALVFGSLASAETADLTPSLTVGDHYRVGVEAIGPCGTGSSSTSTNSAGTGTDAGDFISADLVFEQSTADAGGITQTVGWYAGVTGAVTESTSSQSLNYLLNAPDAVVPGTVTPEFQYTAAMKTTLTGASVEGRLLIAGVEATTTAPVTSDSLTLRKITANRAAVGADLDTKMVIAGTVPARIGWSVYRFVLPVRDRVGPTVFNFGTPGTPTRNFNPNRTSISIVADLCDYSAIDWTITLASVNSHPGLVLPSGSGSGSAVPSSPWNGNCTSKLHLSWTWNGKNADQSSVAPDDDYIATLTPTDGAGVSTTVSPLTLTVDTIDPVVGELTATQSLIGANADAPQNLSTFEDASISGASSWAFTVTQAPNAPVRGVTGTSTSLSVPFNAKTISNVPVPSGSYVGRLVATDLAGNQAIQTKTIEVDNSPPAVTEFAATNPFFSPGSSLGVKDTTTFSANVSDPWGVSWTLDMHDTQGATVRSFDSSTSTLPVCWDGSSNATPSLCTDATHGAAVADGTYTPVLSFRDGGNNTSVTSEPVVLVDTAAPAVTALAPLDHGNTVFTDQRLIASASDSLSGLVGSSATTNTTATDGGSNPPSTTTTFSGAELRTTPLSVSVGRKYLAIVHIDDKAGNTGELQVHFSVIDVAVPSVTAVIPDTTSATTSSPAPGQVTFTFTDVPVHLPRYPVGITGETAHPGIGQVGQRIDLSQATLTLYRTVAGSDVPLGEVPVPASWGSADVFEQLATLAPYSTRGLSVRATQLTAPLLTATVATVADKAVLHMSAPTVSFEPYCGDPASCQTNQFPSADPFTFYIGEVAAKNLSDSHEALLVSLQQEYVRAQTEAHTADPTDFGTMYHTRVTPNGFWGGYHYQKYGPQQPDGYPILKLSATYPAHFPSTFALDCIKDSCSYNAANADTDTCAGDAPWYAPCQQWFTARSSHSMGDVDSTGHVLHTFGTSILSSWGVNDADHDDLGWGHDMQVSLTSVRKYAHRAYKRTVPDWADDCESGAVAEDAGVSGPDEAYIFSSHGAGFEEGSLKQSSGGSTDCNWYGETLPKRLGWAYVSHTEKAVYVNTDGLMIGDYGHSYEQNSTSWSCGAQLKDAGCSFSIEDTVHSWLAQDEQNYHY